MKTVVLGAAVAALVPAVALARPLEDGIIEPGGADAAMTSIDFDLTRLSITDSPDPDAAPPPSAAAIAPPSAAPIQRYGVARATFGDRVGLVKWELAAVAVAVTANNLPQVLKDPQPFRFTSEGFFGRDTGQLGVDKLAHAWNSYLFTDVLYRRMARKNGGGRETALTAAALGVALQTYGEVYDAFHHGSGFSFEDMAFNGLGAGFSVLRHTVPGLSEKVDYRLLFKPLSRGDLRPEADRFEQQWFLFAIKPAGFASFRHTPLRLVEVQVGYHARNFSDADRAAWLPPERKPFVGVGVNVGELLFRRPRGVGKLARATLDYFQPPYVAVHAD